MAIDHTKIKIGDILVFENKTVKVIAVRKYNVDVQFKNGKIRTRISHADYLFHPEHKDVFERCQK